MNGAEGVGSPKVFPKLTEQEDQLSTEIVDFIKENNKKNLNDICSHIAKKLLNREVSLPFACSTLIKVKKIADIETVQIVEQIFINRLCPLEEKIPSFTLLDLSYILLIDDQSLHISKMFDFLSKARWATSYFIKNDLLKKFRLNDTSPREIVALWKWIDSVDAPPLELLSLYKIIASQDTTCTLLIRDFHKLRLGIKEKVALCECILSLDNEINATNLIENFSNLGLGINERAALCEFCISLGKPNVIGFLLENFSNLGLDNLPLEERLKIYLDLIKAGGEPEACKFINKFNELGLERATIEQRLKLIRTLILVSDETASEVSRNFNKLVGQGISFDERLSLCKEINKRGELAELSIRANFENFGFLKDIANCDDPLLRLSLCKELIVSLGIQTVRSLIDNFQRLGLQDEQQLLTFVSFIVRGGYQEEVTSDFFSNIPDEFTQLQILLDLLTPPSPLRGKVKECLGITAPVLAILDKEDGDIPTLEEILSLQRYISNTEQLRLLQPFCEATLTRETRIQRVLFDWISFTAGVLIGLNEEEIAAIEKSGILKDIYEHQNPTNRYLFVRNLSHLVIHHPELLDTFLEKDKKWSRLSALLLSPLATSGMDNDSVKKILGLINKISGFKDPKRFNALIQFLHEVIAQGPYYPMNNMKEIGEALIHVLSTPKKKGGDSQPRKIVQISKTLEFYTNLLKFFGKEEFFNCLEKRLNPQDLFEKRFQTLFNLNSTDNIANRYRETFGNFRQEMALITYLRTVNSLPEHERVKVKLTLNDYVNSVMDGTFLKLRYQKSANKHLAKVFESNEGIEKLWLDNASPIPIIKEEEDSKPVDYADIFRLKFKDNDLSQDMFPRLKAFIDSGLKEVITEAVDPKEKFQNLAIQLCQSDIKIRSFLEQVRVLDNLPLGEFRHHLDSLNPNKSVGENVISESDNPCDLLLIGTEIKGSCQRVDGDPQINKCLLGYLMNGEIKAIVVKDHNNRIVARSMLRLLWDDNKQAPVLFLERYYSNVNDLSVKNAIEKWAVDKAKKMNIPLVSKEWGGDDIYVGEVQFLGGYAPFVYTDASEGVMAGPFSINDCELRFLPQTV